MIELRIRMHHRPSAPPLSVRLGAATRPLLRSIRRLALAVVVTGAVTAALLTVPVLSGPAEAPPVALDASSSRSASATPGSSEPPESSTSAFPGSPSAAAVPPGTATATPRAAAGVPAPTSAPPAVPPTTATATATSPADVPPAATPVPPPAAGPSPTPPAGAATATATATASQAPPATVAAAAPAEPSPAGQLLDLVNEERGRTGCEPLTADPALDAVARAHSADMRDRGFFAHVNPDRLDAFDRADRAGVTARAENIARGQAGAAAVMDAWMDSAGHRANILDCGSSRLGVGIAEGPGGPWWTQLFG